MNISNNDADGEYYRIEMDHRPTPGAMDFDRGHWCIRIANTNTPIVYSYHELVYDRQINRRALEHFKDTLGMTQCDMVNGIYFRITAIRQISFEEVSTSKLMTIIRKERGIACRRLLIAKPSN